MASMANEQAIRDLAEQIGRRVKKLAENYAETYPYRKTPSERREWTWAVGRFWEEYCQSKSQEGGPPWELCARDHATKEKGEYLVDFMLFQEGYGPRIACESEWGMSPAGIQWDFEKLAGVKSDIKVLVHQCRFEQIERRLKEAIRDTVGAHVSPSEAFLVMGFESETKPEACWWIPDRNGPFTLKDIEFQVLPS